MKRDVKKVARRQDKSKVRVNLPITSLKKNQMSKRSRHLPSSKVSNHRSSSNADMDDALVDKAGADRAMEPSVGGDDSEDEAGFRSPNEATLDRELEDLKISSEINS